MEPILFSADGEVVTGFEEGVELDKKSVEIVFFVDLVPVGLESVGLNPVGLEPVGGDSFFIDLDPVMLSPDEGLSFFNAFEACEG